MMIIKHIMSALFQNSMFHSLNSFSSAEIPKGAKDLFNVLFPVVIILFIMFIFFKLITRFIAIFASTLLSRIFSRIDYTEDLPISESDPEVAERFERLKAELIKKSRKAEKEPEELGEMKEELKELKCKNCGASLNKDSIIVKAGQVLMSCKHCESVYRLK